MADAPPWPWVVALALALEAALGYPAWLLRLAPHPVAWPAALIEILELGWNRPAFGDQGRRFLGVAVMVIVAGLAIGLGLVLHRALAGHWLGLLAIALIATVGLAQRSLHQHVAAVLTALRADDIPTARVALAMIVGRDTERLGAHEIAAAALESLAESFNDGVVAPAFWLLVGGLPGLFAYKAVNTADSLIGHREPRWRMFGWAAARADDVMNLVPARIAGPLIALAAGRGWAIMFRDARLHASPNAGWPEAAMAGGLAVRVGGEARYEGVTKLGAALGDGPAPTTLDLERGLSLYRRACVLLWMILLMIGLIARLAR